MIALYAIPDSAASAREWIVWASEIVAGLAVVVVAARKSIKFMVRQTREGLTDLLKPELDKLDAKVAQMVRSNDTQHAEVARSIGELRADLNAHMAEAEEGRALLQALMAATELHISALRVDLAEPGLPEPGARRVKFPY